MATTLRAPRLSLACCLLGLLATGLGCGSREPSSPPPTSTTLARGGELVATIRSEPATYNRYAPNGGHAAVEVLTLLTQARLVRVNRATDELEPWVAEGWAVSQDGLTYTVTLRRGITFSDGQPLTTADVLFSFRAAYDPSVKGALDSALRVGGRPLEVAAVDDRVFTIRFPEPFAPGLRLIENLPILPKHKLEAALTAQTFGQAWSPSQPLTDVVGLGPFTLTEHVAGQRLVFARNPRYFRRDAGGTQLPYLDKLTLAVVPDQDAEALRLESSEIDLMTNGDIRPQDYARFARLADEGRVRLHQVGIGLDPDFLAFNLTPQKPGGGRPWLRRKEFRQAISCGVDRQAIVNVVYLGAAVPIYGPITPGNKRWHSPEPPPCTFDRAKARALLEQAGLTDRNGDGALEDSTGQAARFSILTQGGHLRERVSSVLQEQLRQLGVGVDIVTLDPQGLFKRWQVGDYDTIYFGLQASSTDPALNPDFWFSSGPAHFWNPMQKTPASPWEARMDTLLREQAAAGDLAQRQRLFGEVQRIMADELPSIYFVAPGVTVATSPKVAGAVPALQIPQLLWNADSLAVSR